MDQQTTQRPSFWLLADNSVSLGGDLKRIGTFVASLKHALMFHERILLSDSLVVNTPNFRRAIQADKELRDYMAAGSLVIARRKQGERLIELTELRENLLVNGSVNPGFDKDDMPFRVGDDLEYLQKFAPTVPYDVSTTRDHYTDSIKALTVDVRFRRALGEDADTVCRAILERIKDKQYLDQTFLAKTGPDSLAHVLGEEVWNRTASTINEYQKAFYYSAIPTLVGADIAFSEEHERQRRILRRIDANGNGGIARVDLSRGAKSLYEAVLSNLSARKLKRLRDSSEFQDFQRQIIRLQQFSGIDDPALEAVAQDTHAALHAYHQRIDKDLAILRYFQQGSALLDQWNLKGILQGGEWLLRFGAKPISDGKVRATLVTSVAELLHLGSIAPFIVYYYSLAGKNPVEEKLDRLPDLVEAHDRRRSLASSSTARIEAEVDIAPRKFKDTIYNVAENITYTRHWPQSMGNEVQP
jgi:hypothetical protein